MDVNGLGKKLKKIKFALVFFCAISLLIQCTGKNSIEDLVIEYEAGEATGVSLVLAQAAPLQFYLSGQNTTPILGQLEESGSRYLFKPVIPFTRGEKYDIRSKGELLVSFKVDGNKESGSGELMAIYPSKDTVPENLLKIYLQFSQPMQQVGEVRNYIEVRDETTKEVVDVFLDMETELWNKEHNRLTLWLDPGRIKTDLIPNREQGLPLLKGHQYKLKISRLWKTAQGIPLNKDYSKGLVVISRDSTKPEPEDWVVTAPESGKKEALQLYFNEVLDAILAMEAFTILNSEGEEVSGSFSLGPNERSIYFEPVYSWKKDNYTILIDPILEDMAGNNLKRLFDTDVSEQAVERTAVADFQIRFRIAK
ncbi:MAG: hypothetical protein KJN76_12750 [Eudoraea sp.]|nr:hypothetical protein [Eudoraea sp.]